MRIHSTVSDFEIAQESEAAPWIAVTSPAEAAAAYGGTVSQLQKKRAQRTGPFSFRHRVEDIGPITLSDIDIGSEFCANGGEQRSTYFVTVVRHGRLEVLRAAGPAVTIAGEAAIISPQEDTTVRWTAGTKALCLQIDRHTIEEALSDALGRQTVAHVEFGPTLSTTTTAGRAWTTMLAMLTQQFLHRDGVLHRPMTAMPFIDSLVRGLLIAADHPHRHEVDDGRCRHSMPKTIRTAIDIIEARPHLPMTVSSLAAQSNISVRSLQQGFRRTLGTTPMAYLREVRLRRAHRALLDSDPTTATVLSIANQWGFTNIGRFAAMHAARYGETPSTTLGRCRVRART